MKTTTSIIYITLSLAAAGTSAFSGSITKNVAVPGLKNGMDYCKLGTSDLEVSKVCMGTMTFGEQNTLEEGVEQLNLAFDQYGINFIDTAELYPVPGKPDTQGMTDKTVAAFLKGRKAREDVVLATKVCGYSDRMTWMPREKPDTPTSLTKDQILYSVDASLKRLYFLRPKGSIKRGKDASARALYREGGKMRTAAAKGRACHSSTKCK